MTRYSFKKNIENSKISKLCILLTRCIGLLYMIAKINIYFVFLDSSNWLFFTVGTEYA
jgi:hypothetical protein